MTKTVRAPDAPATATRAAELARLAEAAHVLSRTLRRSGELRVGLPPLPASEFDVLRYISTHAGATVSGVARALRLQTSNVSTTVRALVGRGLVERVPDPDDGRRSLLRPSDIAMEHRDRLEWAWARSLADALRDLPHDEAERLIAAIPALVRVTDALTAEA